MTRDDLRSALADPQIAAFLRVIREGESNQDDSAYTLINGGEHFTSFADHPYAHQAAPPGKAAGAYQFIPHTWDGLVSRYGFPDFSPPCQDEGAVALVLEHHAGDAIKAGAIADACKILASTWVSLPGLGTARAERTFVKFGGVLPVMEPGATTETAAPPEAAQAPQGAPMGIALALLPLLAQYVPQIMTMIKPNSVSTAKDAALAQTVLNVATQAAGVLQPGEQAGASHVAAAVEKMQADPELAKKVQAAVVTHPDVMPYLTVGEIGGGIAAARTANVPAPDAKWWTGFVAPVFIFGMIFCGMIILILGNILGMPWGGSFQSWSSEVRASVISSVIAAALGAVTGYWFGTTLQSAKKDNIIAQQAGATPDTTQG